MSIPQIERINFSLIRHSMSERSKDLFCVIGQVQTQIKIFGVGVVLLFLAVALFACKSSSQTISPTDIKRSIEANQNAVAELFASGSNTVIEINEDEEEIYIAADEMPLYDGKPASEGISSHARLITTYPIEAHIQGITGRAIVEFIVVENGSLANVKILKSAHPLLDDEALRVIKALPPKWTPGKIDGKPVKVRLVYPLNFLL